MSTEPGAPNPWPDERVVVVSDDPPSVEAAVTQLEAWGAFPAVMFERSRALRALSVREPDVVVLDFGRDPIAARTLLGSLEQVQPVLPGPLHSAPVVALAEGPIAPRLERDAWAPLHVAPHDDPDQVRAALLAALGDAIGATAAPVAAQGASAATAVPLAAASVAVAANSVGARRSLLPLLGAAGSAALLAAAGIGALLRMRAEQQASGAAAPTQPQIPSRPQAQAQPQVPPTAPPTVTPPAAVPTATVPQVVAPTSVPVTPSAAPAVSPAAPSAQPPAAAIPPSSTPLATTGQVLGAEVSPTPARFPSTGGGPPG